MQQYLDLNDDKKRLFNYGVRIMLLRRLKDLDNTRKTDIVQQRVNGLLSGYPDASDAELLNYLRVKYTSS